MLKKLQPAAGALLLLLAAAAFVSMRSGMPASAVIRKLSGMRVALTLYRLEHKTFPGSFARLKADGKLEAVPVIKLAWHLGSAKVTDVPAFRITDTGAWSYVNDPADANFGLVYIDCRHKDEKGRFWSEF